MTLTAGAVNTLVASNRPRRGPTSTTVRSAGVWREGVQRHGGGELEEADRRAGVGRLDLVDPARQFLVADQGPGHADALGEADQMR